MRSAEIKRTTKETDIYVKLSLDGKGDADIHTGIGFFDHMLNGFARHGFFDLTCKVNGDLYVDGHHTVEDTGIVLETPSGKRWVTKRGSTVTVILFCPWTMRCVFVPWIYAADRTWIFPVILPWIKSVNWTAN